MTAVDFSVVVCAHDERRWDEIVAALGSLEAQTVPPREVIVVVDDNPALLDRIRSELGVAAAVENSLTPGLGGARNSGLAVAAGSVVAFIDDDAIAPSDWLQQLGDAYEDDDVVGVGGGATPRWEASRPEWFPREFDWVVGCSYLGMPESPAQVRNLFGCNMSYRRQVLVELGGFKLGYGCDETEFCIRVGQRWPSRKLIYVPGASVSHWVPADRTGFPRFLRRCYFEGGSKAVVGRLVGSGSALATEMDYTVSVLPRGVARGVADLLVRRDVSGLRRAGAIIAGLASTTWGWIVGNVLFERAAKRRGWTPEQA